MLALLGTAGVVAALCAAILLAWRGTSVARGATGDLVNPARLLLAGAITAMAAMQLALLTDDFSLAYVANHHSSTTPFPFDVATAWAALEGSIILWGLVLAAFTWAVLGRYRKAPDPLGAAALAVMGGVAIFFFGLMVTVANPFEVCTSALEAGCAASSPWPMATVQAPVNGPGPNPLLQNHILMAIHPPMLYLGYVGLTVPFAYGIGALALAVPGPEWLRRSHRSTLVAWSFLTVGITLGGWWAYEVLSWGGYWAWDPVENASLMPWLAATAFIHSGLVQQRRGMLQAWNFVLVISAFALTILGTFLTRSGTINSVHSFTQSAIGPALLGFLVLVLVGSFALFTMRAHLVASSPRIDTFVSREGLFLVNNLLLAIFGFIVLIGTTYPLLVEAFTGTQVGVGQPFFNRLAVPLSFLLLLVMGFGPVTPWGGAPRGLLWRRLRAPTLIALAAGLLTALFVTRLGWVILAVTLGTFVASAIVGLLVELTLNRTRKSGAPLRVEVRTIAGGDQPFWAGQLSHLGVVLVAIGIAFAANLGTHAVVDLEPGENVDFAGYQLVYESPFRRVEPNRVVEGARITVLRGPETVALLEPRANFYGEDTAGVITPAVLTTPAGDLYLTLKALDSETLTLGLDTSPMVWLLWLGGLTTAAGGVWSLLARRSVRRAAQNIRAQMSERLANTVFIVAIALMAVGLALLVSTDPVEVDRVEAIGSRIKCPVCQGESIADSPSGMAGDMMALVEEKVAGGATDQQVIDDLLASYSGAVLLDPPLSGITLWVWVAPALVAVVGIAVIIWWKRHPSLTTEPGTESSPRSRRRVLAGWLIGVAGVTVIVVVAGSFLQDREGATAGVADLATDDLSDVSNETMEAVIAVNLDHPQINGMRLALAERYFEEGDYRSAFPHYLAVAESGNATDIEAASSLTRLGWMAFEGNGEVETANRLLDQALAIEPGAPVALYLKGRVQWCGSGDNQSAVDLFEQVLDIPDLPADSRSEVEADLELARAGEACP